MTTLGIFKDNSPSGLVSSGDFLNPIILKQSNSGGIEEFQLYLRHANLAGDGAEFSASCTVQGVDLETTADDVSSWVQIAPDSSGVAGTYGSAGAAVNLGNVNLGDIVPFWVKITVPSNNYVGARQDLALRLTSSETNTVTKDVPIFSGSTSGGTAFDPANDRLIFSYQDAGDTGEFISEWVDVTNANEIVGINYTIDGGIVYAQYRTADDNAGTNASAWVSDPSTLNLTQNWLQIKILFYGINQVYVKNGLTRYVYDGTNFEVLLSTTYGVIPFDSNPGSSGGQSDTFSVKYIGYFWANSTGTYNFRMDTDDAARLYINGVLYINQWDGGPQSHNVNVSLTQGWHKIEYQMYDNTGGQYINCYITEPSSAIRGVLASDFLDNRYNPFDPVTQFIYISDLQVQYAGAFEEDFDITFYIGPATPELISPPDAWSTQEFNPELTAVSARCDHIQFQLDMVTTFSGDNLITWEVAASEDIPVTTQSPIFDRPSGVWYWRARAKLDGVYGEWSDYRNFTILPFVGYDQFFYLNVNNGFDFMDSTLTDKCYYLNVAVGAQEASLYYQRHIYLNANLKIGAGEVIYPLYDRTLTRKTTFTEDGEMFT